MVAKNKFKPGTIILSFCFLAILFLLVFATGKEREVTNPFDPACPKDFVEKHNENSK